MKLWGLGLEVFDSADVACGKAGRSCGATPLTRGPSEETYDTIFAFPVFFLEKTDYLKGTRNRKLGLHNTFVQKLESY